MKKHYLKIECANFEAVINGQKKIELRLNDRDYQCGDILLLMEYNGSIDKITGRRCSASVVYVLDSVIAGLMSGYVILSISDVKVGRP